jgi:hypothetical protein
MFHALEESEKLITSELPESQVLKLSTDLKRFNNLMLEHNVVCLILERSEMTTFHSSYNVRPLQLAQLF